MIGLQSRPVLCTPKVEGVELSCFHGNRTKVVMAHFLGL